MHRFMLSGILSLWYIIPLSCEWNERRQMWNLSAEMLSKKSRTAGKRGIELRGLKVDNSTYNSKTVMI
jgi:hypothetical protein